jgi:membrane protein DedA with SNARE-associated domain/fermentation-respiration switch protein FrsA (DUF1100 family)
VLAVHDVHRELLGRLIERYGYLLVAVLVGAEGVGVPLPGETALLTAAAYAAQGRLSIAGVIIASSVGTIAGGSGGYWLGRTGGLALVRRLGRYVGLNEASLDRTHAFFEQYGARTVFVARFIALLRIAAGLLAGAARMPFGTFSLYNALGGVAWSALMGSLGYAFGRNLPRLEHMIGRSGLVLVGVVVAVGVGVLWYRRHRGAGGGTVARGATTAPGVGTAATAAVLAPAFAGRAVAGTVAAAARPPVMQIIGIVAAVAVGIYALVVLALVLGQKRMVFPAWGRPGTIASDASADATRIDFMSADGVPQVAWRIPAARPSRLWVLYFHGNGSTVPQGVDRYALLRSLGFNVFAPEYRGYAGVPGTPGEEALAHDARAAWDYLLTTERVQPDDVVVYGWSLGSAVAIRLATTVTPRAVVAEAAPSSIAAVARERFPVIPVDWIMRGDRFESAARIGDVHAPMLLVHADDDQVVAAASTHRLYERANAPKAMLELPMGGHVNGPLASRHLFVDGVTAFLAGSAGLMVPGSDAVPGRGP